MTEIKGKKVRLRDWNPSDLSTYERWQLGAQEWKKFDGPYYQTESTEEIQAYLQKLKNRIAEKSFESPHRQFVVANLESDLLIGTVSSYWISQETNWLACGITIFDPAFWSGGIGTEALSLWIDYLFENRPEIVRLDLQTWSGNERMMRLAMRLGFRLEGQFRKARIVEGKHYDSIQYGILREEWSSCTEAKKLQSS